MLLTAAILAGCTGLSVASAPTASPRLLIPAINADLHTAFPEFTWREVAGATNYVITLTAPDGRATSRTTTAPRFIPSAPLGVGADYTWTVIARNLGGEGPASTPRAFRVVEDVLPAPPVHTVVETYTLGDGAMAWTTEARFAWRPRGVPGPDDHSEFELLYADGGHMAGFLRQGPRTHPSFYITLDDGLGSRGGDLAAEPILGADCGATYGWRVRTLRGSLLRPPRIGYDALVEASRSGVDLAAARSPWSEPWTFRVPDRVAQRPVLRSPANGASVNSGRLEWSHPLASAEPLVYEVEITSNPAEHQQNYWVQRRPQSPSLREVDRARLVEPHFPVVLGTGGTVYWRVRASRAEALCAGPWSDWWSFTWTGRAEGLGSLPPPTCITDAQGNCNPTGTVAPTASRTPRPTGTATRTPTPTLWLPVITLPGVTIAFPTSTPAPKATDTDAPPPPDPNDVDDDGDGWTEKQGDCDDGDDKFYPGAPDIDGDLIDHDCDGKDG